MLYNKIDKAQINVSIIGLGCEHLVDYCYEEVEKVIRTAICNEINIFDVFMAQQEVRKNIGKALAADRKRILLQGHMGAVMISNQPTQSRELKIVQSFFEDFMRQMNTDYVDIGFLHFVDSEKDYKLVFEGDVINYAAKLKENGTIRAIGLSSHSAEIALKAVKTGLIDVLMFAINPAFDLMPKEQNIFDIFSKDSHHTENWYSMELARQELYDTCKSMGVGIVAMKPLGGGILLNNNLSPFGKGLSVNQCIHYALTNPAVATVMVGCKNENEVKKMAGYIHAKDAEKDYLSILSKAQIDSIKGKCMYCNHCLPCPSSIDIAAVIKYSDLASINKNSKIGVIKDHYKSLERNASHCIECGKCESKCPFEVKVIKNMRRARKLFSL